MATTANTNVRQVRARYGGEERWFPLLRKYGPSRLRRGFVGVGVPPQVAGNVVWFLEDQEGHPDRTQNRNTRTRYRHLLANLDPDMVSRAIPG